MKSLWRQKRMHLHNFDAIYNKNRNLVKKKTKTISSSIIRSGILSHFPGFSGVFHRVLHRWFYPWCKKASPACVIPSER